MKRLLLCLGLAVLACPARDVTFGAKEFELPGTLTLPSGKGPFPAIVLVHGSGPNDRDETIGPNKPFRDIAEGLDARGIAVLRYDKRTKVYGAKGLRTMDDEVVTDVVEAVHFLRTLPEIDPKRVYVLGHSQGGYAVPRIVAACPDLAGAIIAAGPVSPLLELVRDQILSAAPLMDPTPFVTKMRANAPDSFWADLETYRPGEMAKSQKVPLLFVQGERDANVPMKELALWKTALDGRSDVTYRTYPKLNHLFMPGEGAAQLAEMMKPGRVDASVISDIAAFMGAASLQAAPAKVIRVGIIGTDTSHVPAFTRALNDASAPGHIPGARVVAAFKGGSQDIESSRSRVEGYAKDIESKYGVEIVPDIATLLSKVDAVLLESNDGRIHLSQAKAVIAAKKPLFIDKPLASTLADARQIAKLASDAKVPWFSSSSLRFAEFVKNLKAPDLTGALAWSPGSFEEHHQLALSWYAIHGVETLYALMGRGCEEVVWTATPDSDEITGKWPGSKIGSVRLQRPKAGYGAVVWRGAAANVSPKDPKVDYLPLIQEIVKFFQTGQSPVDPQETLEIFEFMDAAQRSKDSGGKPARLARMVK